MRAAIAVTAFGSLVLAAASSASSLPPPTPEVKDFEYTSTPTFTGYNPTTATVSLFTSSLLLYGTPTSPGGMPRKLELFDIVNADVCYSTTCPSTTTLYPQPNYVLAVGGISFRPSNIVPGTGVNTVNTDFTVSGALFHGVGGLPTGETISAEGMPVLYTGDDSGGTSSYVYFRNADGTYSNTLHVFSNTTGGATLLGVILDPPQTLILDILGFTNPDMNSFVTAPIPEPAAWQLSAASLMGLSAVAFTRRKRNRRARSGNTSCTEEITASAIALAQS